MIVFVATVEVNRANNDTDKANAEAAQVEQQSETAKSTLGQKGALIGLLKARVFFSSYVLGLEGLNSSLKGVTPESMDSVVNQGVVDLKATVAAAPPVVQEAYQPAIELIDKTLPAAQGRVLNNKLPRSTAVESSDLVDLIITDYSTMITELLSANTRLSLSITDPELRNGVELLDLASRRADAELRILASIAKANGFLGTGTKQAGLNELAAGWNEINSLIVTTKTHAHGLYEAAIPVPPDASTTAIVLDTLNLGTMDRTLLINALIEANNRADANGAGPESNTTGKVAIEVLTNRANELTALAKGDASAAADDATKAQNLAILGLLAAMMVTFLASLSITRPLRKLTLQAEEMASFKLPNAVQDILNTPLGENVTVPELSPIHVKTRDEVRDVAAALNVVQESAVGLAVEQAVLRRNIADSFVNLGRRNQNLIGRQLDFITELERNEADPDTLENLFKLDHLATRMRRNAESLLVLAGLEPPRQWSAPVDVANVIRAALAEVEGYQRVQQRHLDPATIAGSAAADMAHVLAELIENALVFSPPESAVEIFGRSGDGLYTLSVVDQGIGMSPEQLAEANSRLAGTESFTVAPSRYLGHYVAGHLARRIGVAIDLLESPSGGVAVRISIPKALLANPAREQAEQEQAAQEAKAKAQAAAPAPTVDVPWSPPVIEEPVIDSRPAYGSAPASSPVATAPAPAPVAPPAPAPVARVAPAPVAPAAPAPVAQAAPAPVDAPEQTTSSGLKRRVKGANAIQTTPTVINRRAAETPADSGEPNRTDVFRFLTGFQGASDKTNGESK
jgi:signal transduction histidine kinase